MNLLLHISSLATSFAISHHSDPALLVSDPVAFKALSSVETGIAISTPLCFDVRLTNSTNIKSRISRVKSVTSLWVKFLVSIGFRTT